ncbi:hypothetical protein SMITH_164 [Smithella sp. ME-1]|uniref:Uncharacterized protein n=1 Tax=hydrocarbon metagenome TaxID=938273 RepID=A0A0W8FVG7_9ZZZZ|nr:hypothetical protein SMITH_164 [Smithella sp. ME-1]
MDKNGLPARSQKDIKKVRQFVEESRRADEVIRGKRRFNF